jgi:hypothetical protein
MKRELDYFFAALRFFTRLPVPAWVGHSQEQLDHAARYFPLVGILVGGIGAAVTELAALALPLGNRRGARHGGDGAGHRRLPRGRLRRFLRRLRRRLGQGAGAGDHEGFARRQLRDARCRPDAAGEVERAGGTRYRLRPALPRPGAGRRPCRVAPGVDRADPFPRLRARRRQLEVQAAGAAHGAGRAGSSPRSAAWRPACCCRWPTCWWHWPPQRWRRCSPRATSCAASAATPATASAPRSKLAELAFYLGMLCSFT